MNNRLFYTPSAIDTEDTLLEEIHKIKKDIEDLSPFSAQTLHEKLEGSETIVADLNEQGDKVVVKLDEDFKDTIQEKLTDSEEIVTDGNKLYLNNNVSNKINKSLQKPNSAPTNTKLVAINNANAQVQIGIGEGLTLEGGEIKASGGSGGANYYLHNIVFEDQLAGNFALATIISKLNVAYDEGNFIGYLMSKAVFTRGSWTGNQIPCMYDAGSGISKDFAVIGFEDGNLVVLSPEFDESLPLRLMNDTVIPL